MLSTINPLPPLQLAAPREPPQFRATSTGLNVTKLFLTVDFVDTGCPDDF